MCRGVKLFLRLEKVKCLTERISGSFPLINNMLKCCVNSISSLSSGHIIIVKIRKMNWEITVSISVLINILPPEPSSSSWGCDDSPSSPSPQRNQQIFVSAPAAYCTASPCWDIRSGNKCDVMKYFYRKFRVHKQMLLWVLLLFKERKVDEELWNVDDFLEVKVILTSEQRVGTFGLKGHFENLITKWQRIRCLQTFTVGGGARKRVKMKQILTQWFSLYIWTFQNV